MVRPAVIWPARHIGHQIHGPSQGESDDDVEQSDRGCVFDAEFVSFSAFYRRNKNLQQSKVVK